MESTRRSQRGLRVAPRLVIGTLAGLLAAQVPAQSIAERVEEIRAACRVDFQRYCAGIPALSRAAIACLEQNTAHLSPTCAQALAPREAGGATSASGGAPAAAPRASASVAAQLAGVTQWPHTVTGEAGSATVYQPQVISWPGHETLDARVAVGITPAGANAPVYGTVEVAFATQTDLATRSVTLTDGQLVSSRFPSADPGQAQRFEQRIRAALAAMGPKRYPLDTILMSLPHPPQKPASVAVKNEPPKVFVSERPASLVVFDGEPVLAPIAGTPLSFAVNTNWDVFHDQASATWYLLNNGGWLSAPAIAGPWTPVRKLPAIFSALPDGANFSDVKKQIPGRRIAPSQAPEIFVSTIPAEIIVSAGPPAFTSIPGTALAFVSNSDAVVFRDAADGRFYFLVSGRWFAAPTLEGPWAYATPNLPPDFARIPANGPRGFVRVSVPGTPEAQEALIEAQIPQQATLDRSTAKLTVVYAGAPNFAPIPGTALTYAVNTSFDVIRVGDAYYACWQGAWFVAPSPNGPWVLAASVPEVIYTIPPASPLYRVTFVRVYATTPTYVTYGYTSGYTMAYVSAGVVVYGTGWYYPPVIIPAPVPIFYSYPYTYAGAVYYNPATGAWARGGAIYGPYGGVAKAGTAYNPATGAWAHGAAVYGPNGGAGAFSAYNPSTGSYAHGSAVWGPGGASANASWYNARTGISGTTNQNSNAYGRWGSSTITTPNQTIHTQSQSDSRGTAGSFTSSSGAKGAAARGSGGNSAGAVKTASGNVYAGADGNVYKKTDNGWEKYNDGSWTPVQKPAAAGQSAAASARPSSSSGSGTAPNRSTRAAAPATSGQNLAGATSRTGGSGTRAAGSGFAGMDQLDRDSEARTMGAERQRQFGAAREGAFGGGREGGFGGRGGFRR